MVLFLRFNLAETTSVRPPQGRGQAQQEPNLAKASKVEAKPKKTQCRGSDKKPSRLENRTAKNKQQKLTRLISDSRRPLVKVGGPRSYG